MGPWTTGASAFTAGWPSTNAPTGPTTQRPEWKGHPCQDRFNVPVTTSLGLRCAVVSTVYKIATVCEHVHRHNHIYSPLQAASGNDAVFSGHPGNPHIQICVRNTPSQTTWCPQEPGNLHLTASLKKKSPRPPSSLEGLVFLTLSDHVTAPLLAWFYLFSY